MPNALCVAKALDAIWSNQLPTAHQPAMDLLLWRSLCQFHARNALVAARLARILSFATAPASKPSACHATILQAAGCD